ncbi:MAG TPA: transcriptional regulator [Mycobacteriales bacterium]|nr:transcriptional regulator [Mycobacteriales bacterium]
MRKILLSPKWWGLHLFVVVLVLVFLRLGLWQWHRAQSPSGGIQNWAYAFQWPLFAAFGIVLWWRTLRIEAAGEADETGTKPRPLSSRFAAPPLPKPEIEHRDGVRIGITTPPAEVDEDDDEVNAYNAYLARLNARAEALTTGQRRST